MYISVVWINVNNLNFCKIRVKSFIITSTIQVNFLKLLTQFRCYIKTVVTFHLFHHSNSGYTKNLSRKTPTSTMVTFIISASIKCDVIGMKETEWDERIVESFAEQTKRKLKIVSGSKESKSLYSLLYGEHNARRQFPLFFFSLYHYNFEIMKIMSNGLMERAHCLPTSIC